MEEFIDNQEPNDEDLWSFGEDVDIDEEPAPEGLIEGINLNDLCDGKEIVFSLSAKNREFLENEQEKEKEVQQNIAYDLNSMRENRIAPTMTQSFQEISRKMTNVTPDGWVKKKVITAGAGKIVPALSCVMVHYNLFKENHHLPFDSTYMRGRPERIRLGQGETLVGLECAIKTMKKKENSLFFIKWEYAFGALGCPDRIGKKCDIVADITVLNFVEFTFEIGPNDDPETLVPKMDFQRTIIQIKKLLHAGNNDFMKKSIRDACVNYKKALQILRNIRLRNEEEENEMFKQKLKCLINLAVCYNKLGRHEMACLACQEALSIDPNCAKAHFHYGKASVALSNFRAAAKHLRQANKLKPKDEDILAEMQRLNDKRALFEMKDKLFWKKAFTSELSEDDSAELKAFEKELTKNLEECLQKNMDLTLPIPESEEERKICDQMAAHINVEIEKTSDNYIFKISRHSSNNFDDFDDLDDLDDLADFDSLSISNNLNPTTDSNVIIHSNDSNKPHHSTDSNKSNKSPNDSNISKDSHRSNETNDSDDSSETSDSYHTNEPDKSNDSYHSYHSNDYSQSSATYHSNDSSKSSDTYLTNDSYHSDGTNKSNYSSYSNSPYHSKNPSCTNSPQHSSGLNKSNDSHCSSDLKSNYSNKSNQTQHSDNQSNDSSHSSGHNRSNDSNKSNQAHNKSSDSHHSNAHNKSSDSGKFKSHRSDNDNKSNDSHCSTGYNRSNDSHHSSDHNKSSDSHHSSDSRHSNAHNKSKYSGKPRKSHRSDSHNKSNDSHCSNADNKSNDSHLSGGHNKSSDSHHSSDQNKSNESQHSSEHNKSNDSNKSKKSHHSDSHNKSNDSHHSDSHNKSNDSNHSTGHNKSNDSNKSNKSHHSDSHNKSNDSHHSDSHNKSSDSHHNKSSDSQHSSGLRKTRYSKFLEKSNKNHSNDPNNSNSSINSNEDK